MNIFVLVILILLGVWTAGSYFAERSISSPEYTILEKKPNYEIRSYESYILAQVEVSGAHSEAISKGFRILADYIFGNNTKQTGFAVTKKENTGESEKMAMTAPVVVNEKLDMTAPVIEHINEQTRTISFVMPFEYTLETLPRPNNQEIKIVSQKARRVAVLRFSWIRSAERIAKKKQKLVALLEKDGILPIGSLEYAGYNAPFTAPWLNRHEVMIEVE